MPGKKKPLNFEQKLTQLEQIVDKIETGNLTLDESLQAYEEGIKITRDCRQTLDEAEQKINLLTTDESQGASN